MYSIPPSSSTSEQTTKQQTPHHQKIQSQSQSQANRFSRADVISHFPFMDEFGGVDEIFAGKEEKISALNLDEVNLCHFIEKVFNEFKVGSRGMKSSDIPAALEVRRNFESTS